VGKREYRGGRGWSLLAFAAAIAGRLWQGHGPPWEGVVTLDGKPVAGGDRAFSRPRRAKAGPASALTDEDGNFRLSTYSEGDGALPGQYAVVVTRTRGVPENRRQ